MMAAMDEGIGNVTAALDRLGFSDNLITLFVSDNGGPTKEGGMYNEENIVEITPLFAICLSGNNQPHLLAIRLM